MRIAGAGCSLVDFLYSNVDFSGDAFASLQSQRRGDGGLEPGCLVFVEEFEKYTGLSCQEAIHSLIGDRRPDSVNVGGPAIVALILAAQLLKPHEIDVEFHGVLGDDQAGREILTRVRQTPLLIDHYGENVIQGYSPYTLVLSDPNYDHGHGERVFINNIGTSWHFGPEELPDSFFDAGIVVLGGTAIVPKLHAHLTDLLQKAKANHCVTVVNTVFDFFSEMKNPGGQWPLGRGEETFPFIDLLLADREEALRIAGADTIEGAAGYFIEKGTPAFAITHGPNPVTFYADGSLFARYPVSTLPVSRAVGEKLRAADQVPGDTTGCGDNFVGGILASLAVQMTCNAPGGLSLPRAVAAGICAGGSACFQLGGIVIEKQPGQKQIEINRLYHDYRRQIADQAALPPELLT